MKKRYVQIFTVKATCEDFTQLGAIGSFTTPNEEYQRAYTAGEVVFRATGAFPGSRFMSALVRVDGGRAIVCGRRGRRGW